MLVPEISRADLSPHARIVTVPAADLRELHSCLRSRAISFDAAGIHHHAAAVAEGIDETGLHSVGAGAAGEQAALIHQIDAVLAIVLEAAAHGHRGARDGIEARSLVLDEIGLRDVEVARLLVRIALCVSMPALPFLRIWPPKMAMADTMPVSLGGPSLRNVMPLRPLSAQVTAWHSPSKTLPWKNRPSRAKCSMSRSISFQE